MLEENPDDVHAGAVLLATGIGAAVFAYSWKYLPLHLAHQQRSRGEELRFYVALHETLHAAMLSVPWVRERVLRLASDYVSAFDVDPGLIEQQLQGVDPNDPASIQSALGDPAEFLDAIRPPAQRQALERLIQSYWKPCYYFFRLRGHDVESAKDLTQGFFATFIEPDFLRSVAPDRGRFRSFVLAALSHYLSNEYDRRRALKRGGSFNFMEAEADLPSTAPSPEEAFFSRWAAEVLERGVARLKAETPAEEFNLLSGEAPLGMPDHEQKNRRRRLRLRLRELLRVEILPSVLDEREADAELRELLQASSRRI